MIRMRLASQLSIAAILLLLFLMIPSMLTQPVRALPDAINVTIYDFAFNPQNLTVRKCDTILWTNNDTVIHTLWFVRVQDQTTYLLSPPITPGESWSHTFNETTTFQYYSFHYLWITGFITVNPPTTQTYDFPVVEDSTTFHILVETNSTVPDGTFAFSKADMKISFNVTGCSGEKGFSNVTIPKALLRDTPWTVKIDNTVVTPTMAENDTHSFLYFTYIQSSHLVEIIGTWVIPEFPVVIVLPLVMIATLVAVILGKTELRRNKVILQTS